MNNRKITIWFVAFAISALFCIVSLFAQPTNGVPSTGGGVNIGAFGSAQFYIDVGTLVIGALLTAGLKKFGPDIPKAALPFIATFLGFVGGALATVTIGDGASTAGMIKTIALALGNVGIRELKDKLIPQAPTTP